MKKGGDNLIFQDMDLVLTDREVEMVYIRIYLIKGYCYVNIKERNLNKDYVEKKKKEEEVLIMAFILCNYIYYIDVNLVIGVFRGFYICDQKIHIKIFFYFLKIFLVIKVVIKDIFYF